MEQNVKTLDELTDSRILFNKQPPAFGFTLISIIAAFLVVVLIWSIYTPKIYIIRAQGTVTSSESNYVMPSYTGEITECNLQEGLIVEEGDTLFCIKSTDYDLQEKQLNNLKSDYETQISQYKKLVDSIKDNKNYFDASNPDDELYYSTFQSYLAEVKQNTFDGSTYKAYGYTDEQIASEASKNEGIVSGIYYSAIQSAERYIQEAENQIASIDSQLLAITSGQSEFSIKAPVSGTIHLLGDYKAGMVVEAASAVAIITPENADTIIDTYISTADMARIQEGDNVTIAIDGLNQSIYGTIKGKVLQIDSNVTTSTGNNGDSQTTFKVKILPDIDYVVNKTGNKINITNGMTAEARIQYDEITYFNFILEKLGFYSK